MRTPQYERPRSQSVQGRITWFDETPDPVTGAREDAIVSIDNALVYATHPIDVTTLAVGDLVALTWVGSTLRLTSVIAHAPKDTTPPATNGASKESTA